MYGNANYKLTPHQIANVGQWKCCWIYTVAKYKERFLEVRVPQCTTQDHSWSPERLKTKQCLFPWSGSPRLSSSSLLTAPDSSGLCTLCEHPPPLPASHLKIRIFLLHSWAEKEVLFCSYSVLLKTKQLFSFLLRLQLRDSIISHIPSGPATHKPIDSQRDNWRITDIYAKSTHYTQDPNIFTTDYWESFLLFKLLNVILWNPELGQEPGSYKKRSEFKWDLRAELSRTVSPS